MVTWWRKLCSPPYDVIELIRKPCNRSLLHEVHVTVALQEFKITHPVEIILRAQFHFRVLDDLGEIAFAIAPVKCCHSWRPEAAVRESFPLIGRDFIQWESTHSLAANDDLFGFGTEVGGHRLYRSQMQLRCTLRDGAFDPRFLRSGKGGERGQLLLEIGGLSDRFGFARQVVIDASLLPVEQMAQAFGVLCRSHQVQTV